VTETTRLSTTQSTLRNSIDYVVLSLAKIVTSLGKRCFDIRSEALERLLVATDKVAVNSIVRDVQQQRFDVGNVNERRILSLEVTREETPLLEPFVSGKGVCELDSDVQIGCGGRFTRNL
jgi:hypothetical protein